MHLGVNATVHWPTHLVFINCQVQISPENGYLDNGFGFPQPLQADARTVNEI
jgi:hypothetical protein